MHAHRSGNLIAHTKYRVERGHRLLKHHRDAISAHATHLGFGQCEEIASHEADRTTGKAALTPLGGIGEVTAGYKGYGYATVVEILSAALQAGSFLKALNGFDENGNQIPYPLGHFFIAIDPEFFMGLETFKKITGQILRDLRASKKAPGEDYIFTAGEKEYLAYQYRKEHGCPVPPSLQKVMITLRDRWNMDMSWDFEKK